MNNWKWYLTLVIMMILSFVVNGNALGAETSKVNKYPQMFTEDMKSRKHALEVEYNVYFVGAYTPEPGSGYWILWTIDGETNLCHAQVSSQNRSAPIDCDEAYNLYLKSCKIEGNCN